MLCEERSAHSLQCIKLGDATGPTGQPLKPQPALALAGASEPNRVESVPCSNCLVFHGCVSDWKARSGKSAATGEVALQAIATDLVERFFTDNSSSVMTFPANGS